MVCRGSVHFLLDSSLSTKACAMRDLSLAEIRIADACADYSCSASHDSYVCAFRVRTALAIIRVICFQIRACAMSTG